MTSRHVGRAPTFELIPIERDGAPARPLALPPAVDANCRGTATYYTAVGFVPPWIGYVAVSGDRVVGNGGFKGPPRDGTVEIAYFTLPELENRGYATATARALVAVAATTEPELTVIAQTLPQPNASNALLRKLGFVFAGVVAHPEDGDVWEWRLPRDGV